MSASKSDEPTHGGLTLETYAQVLATVRHYSTEELEGVLSLFALGTEDWTRAATGWPLAIEADIESERNELATTFGEAFEAQREELREKRTPLSALLARRASETDGQPPAPSVAVHTPPVDPAPPGALPLRSLAEPSPWVSPAAAQSPRAQERVDSEARTTTDAASSPSSTPSPAPSPASSPSPNVDETAFGIPLVTEDPLPFRGTAEAPPPAADPPDATAEDLRGETAVLGVEIPLEAVLPFEGGESLPAKRPGVGSSPSPGRLTLEQYASLCAELAERPEREGAVLSQYGLGDASEQAETVRFYEAEFQQDPRARKRWEELVDRYRGWLRKRDDEGK